MNSFKLRLLASLRTSLVVGAGVLALSACDTKKQNSPATQNPNSNSVEASGNAQPGAQQGGAAEGNAQPAGKPGAVAVGNPAPALNADMSWDKLKGQVVIVDFWASWCGPCKEELPELEAMYKSHQSRGLNVVGVNMDDEASDMQDFLKSMPLSFPVVHDADKSIAGRWSPPTMPTSYIIDRQGNIALIQAGYERKDLPEMVKKVESLLAQGS